jgi:hypothetical protein
MQWLAGLAATWIATSPPGVVRGLALRGDVLYAGTEIGLFRSGPAGWDRAPFPGAVLALAAAKDGLWVATPNLLWFWDGEGDPRSASLGVGARLRGVEVDADGRVWAASESGLFVRTAGRNGFERDATLPPGDVLAVHASGTNVFVARNGALWQRKDGRFESLSAGLGLGWWELRAVARLGDAFYLAVPSGLWRVGAGSAERIDPGLGELRDVRAHGADLLIASSRGVWRLEHPERPDPHAVPLLDAGAERLLAAGGQTWVATDRGFARIDEPARENPRTAGDAPAEPRPPIADVQAAVLEYLDLAPAEMRRVEARARSRGWLPRVRAGVGSGQERARDRDWDEVLSSGEVYTLFDRHEARDRGVSADLELIWELDLLAAPDDAINISRERRLVIELRDQVLERVNRIYFERLRVLDAAEAAGDSAERRAHELRVAELGAQLDAWTGGRFSHLLLDSPPIEGRQP